MLKDVVEVLLFQLAMATVRNDLEAIEVLSRAIQRLK